MARTDYRRGPHLLAGHSPQDAYTEALQELIEASLPFFILTKGYIASFIRIKNKDTSFQNTPHDITTKKKKAMLKKVSIITINYNGLKDTVEMIESLAIHETYLHEIIIIDNASTDPLEHKLLQSKFPDIQVIRSEKNIGFAGGNNLGISQAKGEYLLFLNNDTIITCPILENLVNALDSDPQIGAVSPKITCWPEKQRLQYAGSTPMSPVTLRNSNIGHGQIDQGQFNKSGETAFTHGAAMNDPHHRSHEIRPDAGILFPFGRQKWPRCNVSRQGCRCFCQHGRCFAA